MPKEKAKVEWKAYIEVLKKKHGKHLEELKKVYFHLKNGKNIIDIFDIMKKIGINEKQEPKLAICVADAKECFFKKINDNQGRFCHHRGWRGSWKYDVVLPTNTFPTWKRHKERTWEIIDEVLKCPVPIIPAKFMPNGKLRNYYLLWEVNEWTNVPPKDPLLLKRLTKNLFVILAYWDLSPIERAIIRGRIT